MKTKFETNVASDIPKTKISQEPELPWKVTEEDLEKVSPEDSEYRQALTGEPPLMTRAIFLVLLLVTIFGAALYFVSIAVVESANVETAVQQKEAAVFTLKTNLEKIKMENNGLAEGLIQMEKRVHDLSTQKELFTAVIESLTKKGDEALPGEVKPSAPERDDKPIRGISPS